MADKLLQKPPFRFLHDTITAIIQTTGFGNDLYTQDESDSSKVNEKQQKITYLEKMITLVGICKGTVIDVRAAKIVAGLEPENTNIFLIALAESCTDSDIDGAEAVRRVLAGEVPGSQPAPKKSSAPAPSPRGKKSEAKSETRDEAKSTSSKSKSDSKADDIDDVKRSEDDPVLAERGKSRGGNRGNVRKEASSEGLSEIVSRPPGLDAEIEKCDGNWELTRDSLGSVIKKPKLTEKLLSKPPFRFLHDVFMEVIRETGFATGLYTPEEMDSANVSEKSQKITFLEKMTKLVGIQLNTLIEAKAAKIVAGLEPEKTNILLQLLAVAIKCIPDSTAAVQAVLSGEDSIPIAAAAAAPAPVEDKPSAKAKAKAEESAPARAEEKTSTRDEDFMSAPKGEEESKQDGDKGDGEGDGDAKRSMRPTTARRRPPKIKEAAKEVKEATAVAKKAEGIIVDGQNDDDELDGVPEEKRLADMTAASKTGASSSANEPQSKLVKDIMSRQAEQEAARAVPQAEEEKPEEKGTGIRLGKLRKSGNEKRGGAAVASHGSGDIEKLRKAVQVLVQHTGPLGSCMDYIQEDISIMKSELDRWESECKRFETEIENESAKTAANLKPLTMELTDLEKQIEDQLIKISTTKASISRNQERIQASLRMYLDK